MEKDAKWRLERHYERCAECRLFREAGVALIRRGLDEKWSTERMQTEIGAMQVIPCDVGKVLIAMKHTSRA